VTTSANVQEKFSVAELFLLSAALARFDPWWLKMNLAVAYLAVDSFLTQTAALDFAFGGQSQRPSNPMLLNGPDGGRPAAVQMTKPPQLAALSGGYGVTGFPGHSSSFCIRSLSARSSSVAIDPN
jgi:hypothetical protein